MVEREGGSDRAAIHWHYLGYPDERNHLQTSAIRILAMRLPIALEQSLMPD